MATGRVLFGEVPVNQSDSPCVNCRLGRNQLKTKLKRTVINMFNTINALNVRIHNLQQRDPVGNARIIAKLKRRVRALENK